MQFMDALASTFGRSFSIQKVNFKNILTEILTCKTSFRKNHFAIEFFQVQFVWKNFIFRDQNFHFL